jgi:hypothetical protein
LCERRVLIAFRVSAVDRPVDIGGAAGGDYRLLLPRRESCRAEEEGRDHTDERTVVAHRVESEIWAQHVARVGTEPKAI